MLIPSCSFDRFWSTEFHASVVGVQQGNCNIFFALETFSCIVRNTVLRVYAISHLETIFFGTITLLLYETTQHNHPLSLRFGPEAFMKWW